MQASIAGPTQLKYEIGPEEVEFQNDLQDGKYKNVEVTHPNERSIQAHKNVRSKYIQHLINTLQQWFSKSEARLPWGAPESFRGGAA